MKTNVFKMKLRSILPVITFAAIVLVSCHKEPIDNGPVYDPNRAPYEKKLPFSNTSFDSIDMKIVKYFVGDPACMHVYLNAVQNTDFRGWNTDDISKLQQYMKQRTDLSDKVSGCGDIFFQKRTMHPADSIWFVQNGWNVRVY